MLGMGFRCAAGLLACAVAAGAASAETRIGGVVARDFTGAVGVRAGQEKSERLFYDHDVYSEERVKTNSESSTRLRFLDSTELTVGPNSNVLLDRFVYDPQSGTGEAAITFSKGVFRFVSGTMRNKEAVTLATPTATIAIRGTHLIITVRGDGSTEIGVIEGAILVRPCGNLPPIEASAPSTLRIERDCDHARAEGYQVPDQLNYPPKLKNKPDRGGKDGGDRGGGKN